MCFGFEFLVHVVVSCHVGPWWPVSLSVVGRGGPVENGVEMW